MRQSVVRSAFAVAVSAFSLIVSSASAQSFPYYGPSAFVNQPVEGGSVPQPPVPPGDDELGSDLAGDTVDSDLDARLKNLEELEKRFATLEEDWKSFQEGEEEAEAAADEKPTMKINGRIHLDWWDFMEDSEGIGYFEHDDPGAANFGTDPESRFAFRRIRLEISGDIPQDMFYRTQVDFNEPSNPEIKDVYLGFKNLPGNQEFIVGNQKRPLGLDHWNSSRFNVFVERPGVVEAFNEDARRLGMTFYGVSDDESWVWAYGLYALENVAESGRVIGDSLQGSGNARLGNTFLWACDGTQYAYWGMASMVAHPDGDATDADTNDNLARFRTRPEARSDNRWVDTGAIDGATWYEIAAAEAVYNDGPLQIVGEYQTNWTHRDDAIAGPADLRFQGGYVYASYFLTGEHIPWQRDSAQLGRVEPFNPWTPWRPCGCKGWGAWNIGARYSYLDLTDEDVLGGTQEVTTLALNWHWTSHAKLQYDVGYGDIKDHEPVGGFTSGNFWTSGLRFACDF